MTGIQNPFGEKSETQNGPKRRNADCSVTRYLNRLGGFLWGKRFISAISRRHPFSAAIRRAAQARLAHGLRPAYTTDVNALIAEARRMAPSLSRGTPVVYFLRLRSGTIYVGCSLDLEQRLDDHITGQACRTTELDPSVAILRIEIYSTFPEARRREAQLKRWSRAKKLALIRCDCGLLRRLSKSHD